MFEIKSMNYTEFIRNIFQKDDACFELLKERAGKHGITICAVKILIRRDSCFAVGSKMQHRLVPYLKVITNGEKNYERLKSSHPNTGLVKDEAAAVIRQLWHDICVEMSLNLEQLYDEDMYIGVVQAEEIFYTYYARNCKQQVGAIVRNIIGCMPRDIYASSMPGVNLVFETADYQRFQVELKTKKLEEKIRESAKIVVQGLTGGVEVPCTLQVCCYHPGMPTYNGYGLARED